MVERLIRIQEVTGSMPVFSRYHFFDASSIFVQPALEEFSFRV
jgi:hypothetical protein